MGSRSGRQQHRAPQVASSKLATIRAKSCRQHELPISHQDAGRAMRFPGLPGAPLTGSTLKAANASPPGENNCMLSMRIRTRRVGRNTDGLAARQSDFVTTRHRAGRSPLQAGGRGRSESHGPDRAASGPAPESWQIERTLPLWHRYRKPLSFCLRHLLIEFGNESFGARLHAHPCREAPTPRIAAAAGQESLESADDSLNKLMRLPMVKNTSCSTVSL